jgi:hypothetical protein
VTLGFYLRSNAKTSENKTMSCRIFVPFMPHLDLADKAFTSNTWQISWDDKCLRVSVTLENSWNLMLSNMDSEFVSKDRRLFWKRRNFSLGILEFRDINSLAMSWIVGKVSTK